MKFEDAKIGKKIKSSVGFIGTIIYINKDPEHTEDNGIVVFFNKQNGYGHHSIFYKTDMLNTLVPLRTKKKGWVNVYIVPLGVVKTSGLVHETKQEALNIRRNSMRAYLGEPIEIEYEVEE